MARKYMNTNKFDCLTDEYYNDIVELNLKTEEDTAREAIIRGAYGYADTAAGLTSTNGKSRAVPNTPTEAKRFNSGKLNWADVPLTGLIEVAKVTTHGAKKYERFNWQKGFPLTGLVDCVMRHLIGDATHKGAFTGSRYDEQSGLDHLAHSCWNILAILHQLSDNEKYGKFNDLEGYKD